MARSGILMVPLPDGSLLSSVDDRLLRRQACTRLNHFPTSSTTISLTFTRSTPRGPRWTGCTSTTTWSRTSAAARSKPTQRAGRVRAPARQHPRRRAARRASKSSTRSSPPNIRARQFELEEIRSWERNPHVYADTLASSLAAQAIFAYAPEPERARRVLSKLRQVPRVVQAARDNIKDPPAMFVKVGIDTWRGAMSFIDADLPRAFSNVDDLAPARRSGRCVHRSRAHHRRLRRRPRDRGPARRPKARSVSGARSSSRSSGSTKASRCRSIGCSRSRCASWQRRRKNSARWPAG